MFIPSGGTSPPYSLSSLKYSEWIAGYGNNKIRTNKQFTLQYVICA